MNGYFIRRCASMFFTILLSAIIIFLLVRVVPGDPALILLGSEATAERVEELRESLGLKAPLPVQFVKWFLQCLQGDVGISIYYHEPVVRLIAAHAEPSVVLGVMATGLAVIMGVCMGVLSAVMQGTIVDQIGRMLALVGASTPTFCIGMGLMLVFGVALRWLPTSGYKSILTTGGIQNLRFLVLPSITLGASHAALIMRFTRSSMLEVLRAEFVQAARAKGLAERFVIWRHAFRNAVLPIITVVSFTLAGLISGATITETVFVLPGIGRLVAQSVLRRDYPVIQGVLLLTVFVYLVVNFVTDLSYALLDPRIRLE